MKQWVVGNFSIVLFLSVVCGLIVPWIDQLPRVTGLALVSGVIFFSCPKISLEELKSLRIRTALSFYVLRFLVLPIPLYFAAHAIIPEYAVGVLLVALAPVGVTSTVIAALMNANPSWALSATVIANVLVVFTMPLYVFYLSGDVIETSMFQLFLTLAVGIFLPVLLYFGGFAKFEKARNWVTREGSFYAIVLTFIQNVFVISLIREFIFNNVQSVFLLLLVCLLLYAIFYAAGWIFAVRMEQKERTSYMICSGVNNIALSIGVAVLYFPAATILLTVIGEIAWNFAVIAFKKYAERRHE